MWRANSVPLRGEPRARVAGVAAAAVGVASRGPTGFAGSIHRIEAANPARSRRVARRSCAAAHAISIRSWVTRKRQPQDRPTVQGACRRYEQGARNSSARPFVLIGERNIRSRQETRSRPQFRCIRPRNARLLGHPAAERIGIDLSELVAEGVEHLPVGIERANPAGQLFAVGDVDRTDDSLDERNLTRDK